MEEQKALFEKSMLENEQPKTVSNKQEQILKEITEARQKNHVEPEPEPIIIKEMPVVDQSYQEVNNPEPYLPETQAKQEYVIQETEHYEEQYQEQQNQEVPSENGKTICFENRSKINNWLKKKIVSTAYEDVVFDAGATLNARALYDYQAGECILWFNNIIANFPL